MEGAQPQGDATACDYVENATTAVVQIRVQAVESCVVTYWIRMVQEWSSYFWEQIQKNVMCYVRYRKGKDPRHD